MDTRRHPAIAGALILAAGLQGCTQLDAVRVRPGAELKAEGAPYNLTFTQYELTVKRRLTSCVDKDKKADLKITTTVEAARKEARDPAREYIIDFAQLRSFFKTSDVTVEYHENGALKSVNATAQDKTGELLKGAFSAAAKIAMLSSGAGGLWTGSGASPNACTQAAAADVAAAAQAEQELDQKKTDLEHKTAQLERRVTVASALGRARGDAERRALAAEVEALYAAKADLERSEKKLAALLKKLTKTTKLTWPADGSTFSDPIVKPLTTADIKGWATVNDEGLAMLEQQTGAWASIVADSPLGGHVVCDGKPCADASSAQGLKYRMPAPGRFRVCINPACSGDDAVLFKDTGLFSQLGPVLTLPLRNYPFMHQTVVLTMNEAGQPTKIGYRSEAGAEKAAEAVNTFVDEYGKVRLARKPKTELDLVKEETELLDARAKLASARKALEPVTQSQQAEATAALKADTALLDAELAKIKAQAALDEARKQAQP